MPCYSCHAMPCMMQVPCARPISRSAFCKPRQLPHPLNLHFQPLSNVRCVQRKTPKRFMIDASGRVRITITRSCLIRSARHVPSLGNNAIHYTCPSIDACRAERKEPWLKSRPATPFSFHSCCNLVFPRHHLILCSSLKKYQHSSPSLPTSPSFMFLIQTEQLCLSNHSSLLLIPQFFKRYHF